MIFNEIKCRVNTCLGLVGGCIPCIPPVSEPGRKCSYQNNCPADLAHERFEIGTGFQKIHYDTRYVHGRLSQSPEFSNPYLKLL